MKPLFLMPALLLSASTACAQTSAPDQPVQQPAARAEHSVPGIQWGPVPPVLPPGAQIAVLQGNPFGEGVYTLRLKMPEGYTVPPHFHPTDEMVTVISGNLLFGQGDGVDPKSATKLHGGEFVTAMKNMHHYVVARGATIIQVHGAGPFAITYVHPEDNPQRTSTP